MALFNTTSQAPQLGFAPSPTLSGSFTQAPVPVGYGQMQGQPTLSRNPNYGVPSGIAALLGGANPMGAPQPSATLTPQQAVETLTPGRADPTSMSQFGTLFGLGGSSPATPPMPGTNPFTGQAFQTFDPTEAANIFTQGRVAEEQAAAAQVGADRIAAEQTEADRVAAEQAAAEAEAARTPYDDPALEQLRTDVMAQGSESYGTKLYEDLLNAFDTSNRTDQIVAQNNADLEQARAEAEASSLALADAQAELAASKENFGPGFMGGLFNPLQETTPEPEPAIPPMSPVPDVMPPMQIGTFGPRDGLAASPLMPGSFDPESGTFLPNIPVAAPVAAPAAAPVPVAPTPAIDSQIMQMGAFNPEMNMAGMFDNIMLPPVNLPAPDPSVRPVSPRASDIGLGDRLRDMGGIFANVVAPGDVGYEELAAAAEPTGPRGFVASKGDFDGRYPFSRAVQNTENQAQVPPAAPVGIDALLGGGRGEPVNIPLPPPPVVTPAEARAAATPKPFVAPDLSALLPKPRTQKVTKPKKGRKKVAQPDQKSSRKKRGRRQRGGR